MTHQITTKAVRGWGWGWASDTEAETGRARLPSSWGTYPMQLPASWLPQPFPGLLPRPPKASHSSNTEQQKGQLQEPPPTGLLSCFGFPSNFRPIAQPPIPIFPQREKGTVPPMVGEARPKQPGLHRAMSPCLSLLSCLF